MSLLRPRPISGITFAAADADELTELLEPGRAGA
jgi:hypothetical protein